MSTTQPRLRVRVTTTYEVDARAWAAEFGIARLRRADLARDVRADVKSYFAVTVPWHLDHIVREVKSS
jgi:hypothetical protein